MTASRGVDLMGQRRRIRVVDGSRYFDSLIWHTLMPEAEFEIIGLARRSDEALGMAIAHLPEVILVDLSHSGTRGLSTIESLRTAQPGVPIIAFTPMSSHQYTQAALDAGASACMAKSEMVDALLQTIWSLIPTPAPEVGH
jgi:DNA-binding NarL/FixJ family response regulator